MISVLISILVAQIGGVLIELPLRPRASLLARSPAATALRSAVYLFVYGFFFVVSWRPGFAAGATLIFVAVFVAISRAKMAFIHEPLVFADLAFIADIFRHPKLFYTGFLGPLFVVGAIGSIVAIIAAWFRLEPHMLPDRGCPLAIVLAGAWLAIALAPFAPVTRRLFERWALAIKDVPEAEADVAADGQLATLVADLLGWRGDDRGRRIARWAPPWLPSLAVVSGSAPLPLIVVAQCESFLDFRRLDGKRLALPALDRARARAAAWGPLETPTAGGYTMRSEFAFFTGRTPSQIGFDRYYPYLRSAPYREHALPMALRRLGYDSAFIHPYHPDFFWRHKGLPAIGFDRLAMLETFGEARTVGDYVSDLAVAERVVAEARGALGPRFIFAATMENHGPWDAGRFDGLADPVAIFKRHLENGDAMLGHLVDAFDAWPERVVLLFYGDHVPLLKAYADPFPDVRTDYVLLELGQNARRLDTPVAPQQLRVDELTWRMLALAGLSSR